MSGQKRAACSDEVPPAKKPRVSVKTVQKWITESDREMITSTWLKHEKADCDYVVTLKCSLSIQFNEKLGGMRNCNHAFVVGLKKLLASSYKDHAAAADMHKQAMLLSKTQSSSYVTEYALIANTLYNLDGDTTLKVK